MQQVNEQMDEEAKDQIEESAFFWESILDNCAEKVSLISEFADRIKFWIQSGLRNEDKNNFLLKFTLR